MIDVLGFEDPREYVTQTATLSKLTGTMGSSWSWSICPYMVVHTCRCLL